MISSGTSEDGELVVRFASTQIDHSERYCTIATTAYEKVTEVRLYEETVAHAAEHEEVAAELPIVVEAVGNAVRNPTHVLDSYGKSVVFVDSTTTNKDGDPLHVPVLIVDGTSGRIRTYYYKPIKDTAPILYRRDDEK